MTAKRLAAAKKLALLHRKAEPLIRKVFLLKSPSEAGKEPIKLLEVVEGAVEAGVMPIYFRADSTHGIEFPSVIIELSPGEFSKFVRNRQIPVYDESWEVAEELMPSV